jgi:hypothetical protein
MNTINNTKDLTKEAPRSPYDELGGYAILPRTIDKCRSVIAGMQGEYHFNCPLDKALFGFKELDAEDFKSFIEAGHDDNEILDYVKTHGTQKNDEEVKTWSDSFRHDFSYSEGEKSEWFKGECDRLGLDYKTSTLFDMLEADDKATYNK